MDLGSVVTGTKETMSTQVRALLMEVKSYIMLLFILMEMYQVKLDLHRDRKLCSTSRSR